MVINTNEIDRRIRTIALEVFPEFDPSYWCSYGAGGELVVVGKLDERCYSYYAFKINKDSGISYNGDIKITYNKKSKGYARRLVEAREKISLDLGAHLILINNNQNPSFWEHMGYQPFPTSLENLAKGLCVLYMPVYKLLSES